jgi:penicillin-binding protein 1A
MTFQLKWRFSYPQLLTIYANRAYFGDNVAGIQAAAQHFFGKDPNELSVAQAALIAGLIEAPSRYSPMRHPDRTLQRRNEVIDRMLKNGAITDAVATLARSEALEITSSEVSAAH